MIASAWNPLFGCSHRHLTRPLTPLSKAGIPHGETYVVCLDCAKQFAYDFKAMRMGDAIEASHEANVLPPRSHTPRKKKVTYALLASVPAALLLGAVMAKKHGSGRKSDLPVEPKQGRRT